jgi:RNA polymerase sigma factor (sigma-70 family)
MEAGARDLVVTVVQEHAESLLRVARRYTGCDSDAEDAYQRTLEIFVKNAHRLDPAAAHKWVHTVCKHEALEVRRQRAKLVGVEDEAALDALDDGRHLASVEERSERFEELTRAAEALRRCKPHEVTALVLKAQGLSYNEIAEREGWTYTKVNRCLTEGRRAFLARFAGIESGAECERWAPVLSAMADGEASASDVMEVRPHLRNCPSCRAMLGGMRRAPAEAAALVPLGAGGGLFARFAELVLGAQERVVAPLVKAQSMVEAAGGAKVAAVAASAAAIAGGGVAVQQTAGEEPARAADRPAASAPAKTAPPVAAPPHATAPVVPAPAETTPADGAARGEGGERDGAPRGGEFAVEAPPDSDSSAPVVTTPRTESSREPEQAAGGEFGFEE